MIMYRAIGWIPFPVLYLLVWLIFPLVYYVAGYRKAVVRQNLSNAFPEKSASEITDLAKKFYRHLIRVTFEIARSRRMSLEDFKHRVRVVNPELLWSKTENRTRSVIVLTIHQGNWEWMLHGGNAELGIPIDPVYKPLHNEQANAFIYQIRSQFGARPLSMKESTRDIIRRRKEFRVFTMVADQSPIRAERGLWTQFMNQEAKFYLGAEILAQVTKFPVLFAQCRRTGNGYYEIQFHEVADPPYDKESHLITERYIDLAEQAIREQPETWLWSNRRWKRDRQRDERLDARDAQAAADAAAREQSATN